MRLETHGRWPLLGAAALAPVTAAAAGETRLRPLAALLWHQTEEWVWPGRFLPWINRELLGSDEDEFPIDRRTAFVVNVVFGWGASTAAAAGPAAAVPAAALYTSHLGNVAMHLGWSARNRSYNPGAITAALALLPTAVAGLRGLAGDPDVSRRSLTAGVAAGALTAAFPAVQRLRLRQRRRQAAAARER